MSDTTDNDDEPTKAELHDRVKQLESTVEKLMPSRRDALRMGAAGIAGAAGLSATSGSADASTGSAGQIGDVNNRPDLFADTVDANQLTGSVKNEACRVTLFSDQNVSSVSKIQFDSEIYDTDNNFDTSTHNWECPEAGLYSVNLQVSFAGGGSGDVRDVRIGNDVSSQPTDEGAFVTRRSSNTEARINASTITRYSKGDKIAAYADNFNSSDIIDSGSQSINTFFEVAFLGGV